MVGEDWDEEVADRASNLTLDDGWGIENDQGSKYYQLHLPESEIEMVDTREGFMNFLRKMENEVSQILCELFCIFIDGDDVFPAGSERDGRRVPADIGHVPGRGRTHPDRCPRPRVPDRRQRPLEGPRCR